MFSKLEDAKGTPFFASCQRHFCLVSLNLIVSIN